MCLAAISQAKIQTVYYGCGREDEEIIGFRDKLFSDLLGKRTSRALRRVQVGRWECLRPFGEWERKYKIRN
jgi:tRNA(Arg) A34 adenosine deaminase TadA